MRHGIIGLILIITFQLILLFKITLIGNIYFPFIWFGYIFLMDEIVYQLKKSSLIYNHFKKFFIMLILSAIFWWIFEGINYFEVDSWRYVGGLPENAIISFIYKTVAFGTVLPAVFETFDFIKALHIFDKQVLKKKIKIHHKILYSMIMLGIISFFLPFWLPTLAFPLVWLCFFLILDPLNYMHDGPSILGYLERGKLKTPLSLMLAGLICGFFWEFWNYWAPDKWVYNIPYLGFIKIFEMPILGYFGYLFFAWELYAMYHFSLWLLTKALEST